MRTGMIILTLAAGIAACGPISPERAADQCEERARDALGPTGEARIGTGTNGTSVGLTIGITSDFIKGRDPQDVYQSCVLQKTGQAPIRPLSL